MNVTNYTDIRSKSEGRRVWGLFVDNIIDGDFILINGERIHLPHDAHVEIEDNIIHLHYETNKDISISPKSIIGLEYTFSE